MFVPRFLVALVIVLVILLIPSFSCASQSSRVPATTPPPIPIAPVLSSPINESITSGLTVKLEWNPSADAISYEVQVSTDSAFTRLVMDKTGITGTNFEFTSGLNWKTGYYWRVNFSNAGGTSSWSESWRFSTPIFQLGKIAFTSDRDGNAEVYVMNADGSNQTRLTNNRKEDSGPAWSPDGTKIAFTSDRDGNAEVYVMNADGSNQIRLTSNLASDDRPTWSPDSTKIAFVSYRDGNPEIYVMNADGSNQTGLTNNRNWDLYPTWSPDGTKIAFVANRKNPFDIYVMNADGSNQIQLTNNLAFDLFPAWSPDGTKIAFASCRVDTNRDIYVMNADGTNEIRITDHPRTDEYPAWSPDGTKIVFTSHRNVVSRYGIDKIYDGVCVMNADGTNETRLTNNPADDSQPSWR